MLDNLVGRGLQTELTSQEEIARLRRKARIKIEDAENFQISLDSRYDLAYEALLQLGLAALRANGYRPDSRGGHHMMTLQTLDKTLGVPSKRIRLYDRFRQQRGQGLYDGSFEPSEREVDDLIEAALDLEGRLTEWLEKEHPELL